MSFTVGLVVYLVSIGLDRADKVSSAIGAVLAVVALVAPYLLPPPAHDAPSATSRDGRPIPPPGADLRHAQGVQINHGGINTQNNTFSASS